jgi:TolA-binding protein
MKTSSKGSEDSRALDGVAERYRDGLPRFAPADIDRGLHALRARVASSRMRRPRWGYLRLSLIGIGVAFSTLLVLQITSVLRRRPPEPSPLVYQIEGGSLLKGGYLRESGRSGIKVRFNEGSEFSLAPGTRGAIRAVDNRGAHVAIDSGTASFRVRQGNGRHWSVGVGPFLVTVTGTIFTTSWDPLSEQFELRLRHGHVVVNGPLSARDIDLQAGERLVVNLAKGETSITQEKTDDGVGESPVAPAPHTATVPAQQSADVTIKRPGSGQVTKHVPTAVAETEGANRWSGEFASGHWDRILDDVNRIGVDATLNRASIEDLAALADAARYRHKPDLARAALLAERRRFPDSPRALNATFLLGRVEESREQGHAQAIAWYDEYLARAPKGTLAAEALGRKMMLTGELEGRDRARPIAAEYLRRFPKGSYAGSARALEVQSSTSAP